MRSTTSSRSQWVFIIHVLAAITLSTWACQADLGGPAPPGEPIQASANEAQSFQDMWSTAIETADGRDGQLALIVDESQLTSFVALRLREQEDPVLRDPQVFLRDGLIQVYGVADQGYFQASVLIGIQPTIDGDGRLSFEVTSAEFGPLPVPDSLREGVSSLISEAFAGSIGSLATGIRLEAVAIDGGEMAISGRLR